MIFAIVLLALVSIGAVPATASTSATHATAAVLQQTADQPSAKVDIDIHRGNGNWWASPEWIAIGALGVVVLLILVVVISRGGGGTTIVRE
jgi:hypothetical protein